MLFDWYATDRLAICLDPAMFDLMQDFYTDKAETRLLEIDCTFSDDYLAGHARRVGLASEGTPPDTMARLLPTLRNDLRFETERIREAGFANLYRIREGAPLEENAVALARFFGISEEAARDLAATEHLFSD
jgi:hypothetical protein